MPISYNEKNKIFKLDTSDSSYIFEIYEANFLVHLYYGAKIPDDNVSNMKFRDNLPAFNPSDPDVMDITFTADLSPLEYSGEGAGDYRVSPLAIKNSDGNDVTDVRYVSHKIYDGKPEIPGLPSLYLNDISEAQTLEIKTEDKTTGAVVTLIYTVFSNQPVITRSVIIENTSDKPFEIERVFSTCVDYPTSEYKMLDLYGRWLKERTLQTHKLIHGIQSVSSKRGVNGHCHNPFAALVSLDANEEYGEAYGYNLVYSGNYSIDVEVDSWGTTRFIMGINPEGFGWKLDPGEKFYSPEAVMVYSNKGIGEMSRAFHRLYRKNLICGEWRDKKRPLLINSWEAAYFDFDDDKLVSFASEAKKLGIEMLVMDDGWFGKRDDDTSSLGDWYVNENKLKGGLGSLIERINALGMKFGIWYEPEMISPDSDLFRAHPDWYLHVPNRKSSLGRHQYILDMSRKDVRDNIFDQMYSVLSKYNIEYLKWDFNRNLTEAGSALLPKENQKEIFHRFILGTYELLGRIRDTFPKLLIEGCSGGGGRFDPAMLSFTPQIWCSDETDPIERLTIQFGTSLCYPDLTMGAHVSACDRTGLETRANVALWGTFGYELDPNKLTDEDRKEVKREIACFNKYYDLIHGGDLYRLINPTDNLFRCAWEFVSPDKKEALVTVVTMRRPESRVLILKLKGLDPEKYYIDEDSGEKYSGALLMNAGINLTETAFRDGESVLKHFIEA
ncbi:MAG: alpha-galactosidase [Clostridiales bacterium]|nr:alpha-galactosidase [Clostridiales bacterium]